jgi:hypothetical protein
MAPLFCCQVSGQPRDAERLSLPSALGVDGAAAAVDHTNDDRTTAAATGGNANHSGCSLHRLLTNLFENVAHAAQVHGSTKESTACPSEGWAWLPQRRR